MFEKYFVNISDMRNKTIIITAFLIIIGLAGYFIYNDFFIQKTEKEKTGNTATSTNNTEGVNLNIGGEGDFKVEPIKITQKNQLNAKAIALLEREIIVASSTDSATIQRSSEKIKELISSLKSDPANMENWLVLGVYRKILGDYAGAIDVWNYVGVISPTNSTSFNNLGELYAYQLKDNAKAEENYQKAIVNDPSAIYIYRNFFDFYRYFAKDMAKARAILEQGIAANPSTSSDLKNLLETLK